MEKTTILQRFEDRVRKDTPYCSEYDWTLKVWKPRPLSYILSKYDHYYEIRLKHLDEERELILKEIEDRKKNFRNPIPANPGEIETLFCSTFNKEPCETTATLYNFEKIPKGTDVETAEADILFCDRDAPCEKTVDLTSIKSAKIDTSNPMNVRATVIFSDGKIIPVNRDPVPGPQIKELSFKEKAINYIKNTWQKISLTMLSWIGQKSS